MAQLLKISIIISLPTASNFQIGGTINANDSQCVVHVRGYKMAQLLKISIIIIISLPTASNFQIGDTINANDSQRNLFILGFFKITN